MGLRVLCCEFWGTTLRYILLNVLFCVAHYFWLLKKYVKNTYFTKKSMSNHAGV